MKWTRDAFAAGLLALVCAASQGCFPCELRAEFDEGHPLFGRFEAESAANNCTTDADCVVGGCSAEACAAEPVGTTCELLQHTPEGHCGCLTGICQWTVARCLEGS